MSVSDVKSAFQRVTADRKIDVKDVDTILQSAGNISKEEQKAIKAEADKFAGMMDPAAKRKLQTKLGEVDSLRRDAAEANAGVQASAAKLTAEATKLLTVGTATKSFGGSQIPDAVKTAVSGMIKNGATAYDVRELKPDPIYDSSHGEPEMTVEGKFNPYSQESNAADSLAFKHTELTPSKIADDMNTVQTYNVITGVKDNRATYEKVTGKGSGNITELYDEANHSDTFARGRGGQKYASNFAILADGSLHAVPAARRSKADPGLILTTASLARGKQMLFNGHIHMDKGVVTYVGMSGRLCKQQADGMKFVDAVEVIKAWGFKTAPGLKVTNEG